MENDNELMTAAFAAAEKGVHVKSVYRAIREGRLKAEQQGKTLLVRRRDLRAWDPGPKGGRRERRQDRGAKGGMILAAA